MANLPSFEQYAGPRSLAFHLTTPKGDTLRVWYSYQTPVAFALNGKRTVRENQWSTTTGRHLNAIDGGSVEARAARVGEVQFQRELDSALDSINGADPERDKLAKLGAATRDRLREYFWNPKAKHVARELAGERTALGDGMARDCAKKLASDARDILGDF